MPRVRYKWSSALCICPLSYTQNESAHCTCSVSSFFFSSLNYRDAPAATAHSNAKQAKLCRIQTTNNLSKFIHFYCQRAWVRVNAKRHQIIVELNLVTVWHGFIFVYCFAPPPPVLLAIHCVLEHTEMFGWSIPNSCTLTPHSWSREEHDAWF